MSCNTFLVSTIHEQISFKSDICNQCSPRNDSSEIDLFSQSETYIVINLAQLMNNQLFSQIIFVNQKHTVWSA